MPWRQTRDPYAVMVSEFMLQQTTVTAVIPYFQRWMARFPTLEALARAAERDVLGLWQGLGYYSRARNLHQAAKAMMEGGKGKVPRSVEALRRLPGVGEYTAAAIASFAFDAAEPVIDANIARVLARLWNWPNPVDNAAGRTFLRDVARRLLPGKSGRLHNSALMDLGALICVAQNPRCRECPIRDDCSAQQPGWLPVKRPRKGIEEISEERAFVFEQGKLWLEPSQGASLARPLGASAGRIDELTGRSRGSLCNHALSRDNGSVHRISKISFVSRLRSRWASAHALSTSARSCSNAGSSS